MKGSEITEQRILQTLEAQGHSWHDYFLFGAADSASVCSFVQGAGMLALLIEDDRLAAACKDYLKGKGAEHFMTMDEVNRRFGWDGIFRMPKSDEPRS